MLKHYPKVEPNDYWKRRRSWDFLRDLNKKAGGRGRGGGKRWRGE